MYFTVLAAAPDASSSFDMPSVKDKSSTEHCHGSEDVLCFLVLLDVKKDDNYLVGSYHFMVS